MRHAKTSGNGGARTYIWDDESCLKEFVECEARVPLRHGLWWVMLNPRILTCELLHMRIYCGGNLQLGLAIAF